MGTLEQVTNMKRQGISDEEIVSNLSQEGVSPREINDALKQAQIKNAVSSESGMEEGMLPSMMPEGEMQSQEQETYTPQQPAYSAPQTYAPRTYEQPAYSAPQEGYAPQEQQYYSPGEGSYSPSGIDTDTVIEIADQLFSEKIKKFQKQLDSSSEMGVLLQTRIESVSERLKKIETMIDKLQIAILEKVGSYGQNLESVKKEMSMMQDSFSKMLSPQKEMKKQIPENSYEEDAFSQLKKIEKSKK